MQLADVKLVVSDGRRVPRVREVVIYVIPEKARRVYNIAVDNTVAATSPDES